MTIRPRGKVAIAVCLRVQEYAVKHGNIVPRRKFFTAIHGIIFTLRNGATAKYCAQLRELLLTHLSVVGILKT